MKNYLTSTYKDNYLPESCCYCFSSWTCLLRVSTSSCTLAHLLQSDWCVSSSLMLLSRYSPHKVKEIDIHQQKCQCTTILPQMHATATFTAWPAMVLLAPVIMVWHNSYHCKWCYDHLQMWFGIIDEKPKFCPTLSSHPPSSPKPQLYALHCATLYIT